jgi:hypothetical protein
VNAAPCGTDVFPLQRTLYRERLSLGLWLHKQALYISRLIRFDLNEIQASLTDLHFQPGLSIHGLRLYYLAQRVE